jgi:hypothetical protein
MYAECDAEERRQTNRDVMIGNEGERELHEAKMHLNIENDEIAQKSQKGTYRFSNFTQQLFSFLLQTYT